MNVVIVIARVKTNETEPLKRTLEQINSSIHDNPYIRFDDDRYTHFARWIVFETPGSRPRLLYMSVFDGDLGSYIAEVVRVSPGLDAIWGHCEGYTGPGDFLRFIQTYSMPAQAPFYAFRAETLQSIRTKTAIRQQIERLVDLRNAANPNEQGLHALIAGLLHAYRPSWLQGLRTAITTLLHNAFETTRAMIMAVIVKGASWLGQQGENMNFPRVSDACVSPAEQTEANAHITALESLEDIFQQNQFTVIADIKPGQLWLLRLVFFLTTYTNRYGWPRGQIIGLYTIYTFHWVLIDDNKRLIGFSNYDGSMENYIGDFLDKFGTGLDVYFKTCKGYPEGGITDVPRFTSWVRQNQLVCQLYYSAYPGQNVLNILRDCEISETLSNRFDRAAVTEWLRRL
jgi:hypothetical protein